jgi:hypothetical protein
MKHPEDETEQSLPPDVPDCSKQTSEVPHPNVQLNNRFTALGVENDAGDEDEQVANQNEDKSTKSKQDNSKKKSTTVIVGESMTKHLDPKRLKRSATTGNQNIHVETYRGSNTEAMKHHKTLSNEKPDQVILHVDE